MHAALARAAHHRDAAAQVDPIGTALVIGKDIDELTAVFGYFGTVILGHRTVIKNSNGQPGIGLLAIIINQPYRKLIIQHIVIKQLVRQGMRYGAIQLVSPGQIRIHNQGAVSALNNAS